MKTLHILSFASLALLPILASCGGGSGGGSAAASQISPSMKAPKPGQLVGNWTLSSIKPVEAIGVPANVRVGMNLRLSASEVEVFLDEYVGPGSILPKLMDEWYGGGLVISKGVTANGFKLSMRSDFGPAFGFQKNKWFTTIDATGTLGNNEVKVRMTREEWVPHPTTPSVDPIRIGRNVFDLTFVPGKEVLAPTGDWSISKVSMITQRAFPLSNAQLAPLPINLSVGAQLRLGKTEVAEVFGTPFPVAALTRAFPELNVRNHYGFIGNGVVEAFHSWEGRESTGFEGVVGVLDLNLFHTGHKLQGDLIVIGILNKGDPGIYHVYLELGPKTSQAQPMMWATLDARPAPWLFPSVKDFEARVAQYRR
ncbi:MAG: hypothetical protein CSA62_14710 [Planctomycetota bacterium]|nr:MAG: hypothetical protein CSA62_14710 [Planctomycetota bacterium]